MFGLSRGIASFPQDAITEDEIVLQAKSAIQSALISDLPVVTFKQHQFGRRRRDHLGRFPGRGTPGRVSSTAGIVSTFWKASLWMKINGWSGLKVSIPWKTYP